LDVSQGSVSVPGAVAAVTAHKQVDVERGMMDLGAPLALFFGDETPAPNADHYVTLARRLVSLADRRAALHPQVAAAGYIINTWY
jgi:polynucleotide 5'-kinase involved in rRNA processing